MKIVSSNSSGKRRRRRKKGKGKSLNFSRLTFHFELLRRAYMHHEHNHQCTATFCTSLPASLFCNFLCSAYLIAAHFVLLVYFSFEIGAKEKEGTRAWLTSSENTCSNEKKSRNPKPDQTKSKSST